MDLERLARRAAGGDVASARRLLAVLEERAGGPPRTIESMAREAARQVVLRAAPEQRGEWSGMARRWAASADAPDGSEDPAARILRWESRDSVKQGIASFAEGIADVMLQGADEASSARFLRALRDALQSGAADSAASVAERLVAMRARRILAEDAESLAAEEDR